MTIQYRFPSLYKILVRLTHSRKLIDAFRTEVGKDKSVFDVAAGFGLASDYIDPSNDYFGIDLNKSFVNYGRKRGLKLEYGDIFDPGIYRKRDVFLLIDVIHHLPKEKLRLLFDLIFTHAGKKVVIMEPNFQNRKNAKPIQKLFGKILIYLDNDGINKINRWFTKEEYMELYLNKFGSSYGKNFELKIQEINPYFLATYIRR